MSFTILDPAQIEKRSFEIIGAQLAGRTFAPGQESIVRRVIHTTADFDYADALYFSPDAVAAARDALMAGAVVVTDTQMALAGINKTMLEGLGGRAVCFMADADVATEAKARGVTRAIVSMERAAMLTQPIIFAIGNAPTALIRLHELIGQGVLSPALVIGVPVGFVNVIESKELFVDGKTPCIIARGRKGGSGVAAAIVNAVLYQLVRREGY